MAEENQKGSPVFSNRYLKNAS